MEKLVGWSPKSYDLITSTPGKWVFTFSRPKEEVNKEIDKINTSCGCTNVVYNDTTIVATVNIDFPKLKVQSSLKTITIKVAYKDGTEDTLLINYKLVKELSYED